MRSQNERHLLMFRLILMSIVLSFIPVIVIHSIIRPDTYSHYAIILVYTLMLMGIGYHMYIRYAERTARELKALVKKEATINGELVLINTEEKLKSIGMHDYRPDDLTTIDRVIKPLFTSGTGDLLQLSDWLEKMDLSLATDVTDVPRLMLANLQAFGLPVLTAVGVIFGTAGLVITTV